MPEKPKIEILLVDWDHKCGDGCCYEYGVDIYVNGEKIEGDGTDSFNALRSVLKHLGYDAEIN